MKKSNGITLISLVITIIVITILSAVSISMTIGENGIITKAKDASEKYRKAEANEIADSYLASWKAEMMQKNRNLTENSNNSIDLWEFLDKLEDNGKIQGLSGQGTSVYEFKINNQDIRVSSSGERLKENSEENEVSATEFNSKINEEIGKIFQPTGSTYLPTSDIVSFLNVLKDYCIQSQKTLQVQYDDYIAEYNYNTYINGSDDIIEELSGRNNSGHFQVFITELDEGGYYSKIKIKETSVPIYEEEIDFEDF